MGSRPHIRKSTMIAGGGVILAAIAAGAYAVSADTASAENGFVRGGEAGFVVTRFAYALGPDAEKTGSCPTGMSKNVAEIYAATPEGQRRPNEGDEEYGKRMEDGGKAISANARGQNYCMHPELAPIDADARYNLDPKAPADGINLDGETSHSADDARRDLLDFTSPSGVKGVDNQFWRLVGCNRSYQSAGQSNGFDIEMYTGSWGILITLGDVDDLVNDDHVEVGIYANADPIQLSPTREALEYATYAMDQKPAFRAVTKGSIVKGVLRTDPVDVRFHSVVNAMHLERPLRDARIEARLSPDGLLKGYLAGYTPVEDMYDFQFGYRNGKDGEGKPSPVGRRLGSANGAARVLGHTCQGVYQGLNRLADGHRDAKTGKYTSISTQYRFEARPAFVVDVDTRSKNEKLARND